MPWREVSVMDERLEFVRLAMQEGVNRRELCRRFGISPDVGYKWLARWQAGDRELADRSRRPHVIPGRSEAAIEERVLAIRDKHPAWGARKIAHCLKRDGLTVPVPSTVHQILCRNGRVKPTESAPPNPGHRFEKEAPRRTAQRERPVAQRRTASGPVGRDVPLTGKPDRLSRSEFRHCPFTGLDALPPTDDCW
jgi:transposase-like protein